MIRHLLHVDFDPHRGLQEQVRETLINAILGGIFPPTPRSLPAASWPASCGYHAIPPRWCLKVW